MDDLGEWTATGAAWVVVDTDGAAFECRRCGRKEPFHLPVDLFLWTEAAQLFVSEHARCRGAQTVAVQEGLL